MRWLGGWVVATAACRAAPPPPAPPRPAPASLVPASPTPPSPQPSASNAPADPLAGKDAAQRLAWARELVPDLAERSTEDPRGPAFTAFTAWFSDGATRTIYLREPEGTTCRAITGTVVDGTFEGRAELETRRRGKQEHQSWTTVSIGPAGIDELGTAGRDLERGEDGTWHEAGVWGTGDLHPLSRYGITRVGPRRAAFRTYAYRLTTQCGAYDDGVQSCEGGGTRSCARCLGVALVPHADGMGFGRGRGTIGHRAGTVDCTEPCPPDEWTPRLPILDRALAGHTFYAEVDRGWTVYADRSTCRADARDAPR